MDYEVKKDKYVFHKDGVYFAMNFEQLEEMQDLISGIIDSHMCIHGMPLEWNCNACSDLYGRNERMIMERGEKRKITQ